MQPCHSKKVFRFYSRNSPLLLPASLVIHNPILYYSYIFNFKFKYDEYDILLKQLIHFCFNICLKGY